MKFPRMQFLNEPEDCDWLRTGHLRHLEVRSFDSFVIYGNEDSPERVDLYSLRSPAYNDQPIAVYVQDEDGNLQPKEQP